MEQNLDQYLTFLAKAGELHAALPTYNQGTPQLKAVWLCVEAGVVAVISEAMALAAAHGHSAEACYAAFDGPNHVPASVPS